MLSAATSALGCASAAHFATAKPLPKGDHSLLASFEATHVIDRARRGDDETYPESLSHERSRATHFGEHRDTATTFAGLPTLRLRYGAREDVQIGAVLGPVGVGFETLWAPIRGRTSLGLLFAPTLGATLFLDAPMLLSHQVSETLALVGSLGPYYGLGDSPHAANQGLLARAGLGLRLQLTSSFFLFPEAVLAEPIDRRPHDTWLSGGLGVGGDMP